MTVRYLNGMSLALVLSLGLMLGTTSFADDTPRPTVFFAKCSLYKGGYSPEKTPIYELDVNSGEYVMPQININTNNRLYWAGLKYRHDEKPPVATFELSVMGAVFSERENASADIVAGRPLEVILSDKPSNSTLRCYNPSAPDVYGAKHE